MMHIVIQNNSQASIYQQIYEQISIQIIEGLLKPDEPLPSIRVTAKALEISVITVKKAYELLELNGYIYTIKGKGSYVKRHTPEALNLKRYETVKRILKEAMDACKEFSLSEEEVVSIVKQLYNADKHQI